MAAKLSFLYIFIILSIIPFVVGSEVCFEPTCSSFKLSSNLDFGSSGLIRQTNWASTDVIRSLPNSLWSPLIYDYNGDDHVEIIIINNDPESVNDQYMLIYDDSGYLLNNFSLAYPSFAPPSTDGSWIYYISLGYLIVLNPNNGGLEMELYIEDEIGGQIPRNFGCDASVCVTTFYDYDSDATYMMTFGTQTEFCGSDAACILDAPTYPFSDTESIFYGKNLFGTAFTENGIEDHHNNYYQLNVQEIQNSLMDTPLIDGHYVSFVSIGYEINNGDDFNYHNYGIVNVYDVFEAPYGDGLVFSDTFGGGTTYHPSSNKVYRIKDYTAGFFNVGTLTDPIMKFGYSALWSTGVESATVIPNSGMYTTINVFDIGDYNGDGWNESFNTSDIPANDFRSYDIPECSYNCVQGAGLLWHDSYTTNPVYNLLPVTNLVVSDFNKDNIGDLCFMRLNTYSFQEKLECYDYLNNSWVQIINLSMPSRTNYKSMIYDFTLVGSNGNYYQYQDIMTPDHVYKTNYTAAKVKDAWLLDKYFNGFTDSVNYMPTKLMTPPYSSLVLNPFNESPRDKYSGSPVMVYARRDDSGSEQDNYVRKWMTACDALNIDSEIYHNCTEYPESEQVCLDTNESYDYQPDTCYGDIDIWHNCGLIFDRLTCLASPPCEWTSSINILGPYCEPTIRCADFSLDQATCISNGCTFKEGGLLPVDKFKCNNGSLITAYYDEDTFMSYYCYINTVLDTATFVRCPNGCLNGECVNTICNLGDQVCSQGEIFSEEDTSGDVYECQGSSWLRVKQCLETCKEYSSNYADCIGQAIELNATCWQDSDCLDYRYPKCIDGLCVAKDTNTTAVYGAQGSIWDQFFNGSSLFKFIIGIILVIVVVVQTANLTKDIPSQGTIMIVTGFLAFILVTLVGLIPAFILILILVSIVLLVILKQVIFPNVGVSK